MLTKAQLAIKTLGECTRRSPLNLSTIPNDEIADFVPDRARVLMDAEILDGEEVDTSLTFEKAGPRETIYFDPPETRVGLSPAI